MQSLLDIGATPITNLRPGETGIRLKDDPYYGSVDIGPEPKDDDTAKVREWELKEREKIAQLPADKREAAEEKLGRDLAKKSKGKDIKPLDPDEIPANASREDLAVAIGYMEESIESGAHVLDGAEQGRIEVLTGKRLQQVASTKDAPREPEMVKESDASDRERKSASNTPFEPAERDRDKTKAAKPGESAKG